MGAPVNQAILKKSVALTTDGSGNASGTITGLSGEILGVYVDLGTGMSSAPLSVTNEFGQTVLTKTFTTDGFIQPRVGVTTNDGTTAITNSYIPYINCGGSITAAVASGTASKSLTVYVLYR